MVMARVFCSHEEEGLLSLARSLTRPSAAVSSQSLASEHRGQAGRSVIRANPASRPKAAQQVDKGGCPKDAETTDDMGDLVDRCASFVGS